MKIKKEKLKIISTKLFSILFLIIGIFSAFLLVTSFLTTPKGQNVILLDQALKEEMLRAYISGAVSNPGVYEIKANTLLIDLIEKAGGLSNDVDIEKVNKNFNLAKRVYNQDHFYIPFDLEDQNQSMVSSANSSGKFINLNSASLSQLETLPGVGPTTAQKIIDNRPYKIAQDIKNVKGIGDATFEKLKDLITV